MKSKTIKFEYDADVDAAYLTLERGKVVESEEVEPGIIVDYSADGRALGVEILRLVKRFSSQLKAVRSNRQKAQPSRLTG